MSLMALEDGNIRPVRKHVNEAADPSKGSDEGVLPASSDSVYVLVEGNTNKKVLIVCSENALAVNSIMNGLKRGIQSGIAD